LSVEAERHPGIDTDSAGVRHPFGNHNDHNPTVPAQLLTRLDAC
jgi:hypothetical protein